VDQDLLRRLIRSCRRLPASLGSGEAGLLERFVAHRDEAAFEVLLWRHGPMVLGVCQRVLHNCHDAEDAFQATFLTLARKAGSIANKQAVGSWLFQVAHRIALRLRTQVQTRARREQPGVDCVAGPTVSDGEGLREVLDEEIRRLPERYRAAFVLCCLEGKTGAEAAQELCCPAATVSSRLTRARERLRRRLIRRGLAPATGLTLLAAENAPALSATLVSRTVAGAICFCTGTAASAMLSAQAVHLAKGMLRAMSLTRLKTAMFAFLLIGALTAGSVFTCRQLLAAPPEESSQEIVAEQSQQPKPAAPLVVRVVKPQPGALEGEKTQPCEIHAFAQADLPAVVAGVLKQQSVDVGSFIKKGQVLAVVDAPLLALDQKQAAAAVRQAKGLLSEGENQVVIGRAEVQAAEAAIPQREADVKSAEAEAQFREVQHARLKNLAAAAAPAVTKETVLEAAKQVSVSRAQVEAAKAAVTKARADLQIAKNKLGQSEAALDTLRAKLEAAEIALEKARYALDLTRIEAPFDGVVTRVNANVGNYVGAGQREPVLTVAQVDRLRVVFQVPERFAAQIKTGDPVQMTWDGARPVDGKVARLGFVLDAISRTMRVEVDLDNPKLALRPGMFGKATIVVKGSANGLRLPAPCIFYAEGKPCVYVVRDGKAKRVAVQIDLDNGKEVEIGSGLEATDDVVVEGQGELTDSAPVKISTSK
jgi:HlyD family secretion protein